jgi:hypothetical protein
VQPFLRWATRPQVIIVRLMTVACLGLLAAALAVMFSRHQGRHCARMQR